MAAAEVSKVTQQSTILPKHGMYLTADKETPLHLASREGKVEVVLQLLEQYTYVMARNEDGETPFVTLTNISYPGIYHSQGLGTSWIFETLCIRRTKIAVCALARVCCDRDVPSKMKHKWCMPVEAWPLKI